MKNISEQLKALREKNDLTQSDMAVILGVKERGAVSLYETGKRKLTLAQYFKLLSHFGEEAQRILVPSTFKKKETCADQIVEESGVMYVTNSKAELSELKSKYIACLEEKENLRQRISELENKK
jgi:transcriptional regulator with XRE-family HTH domain